jgi:hypothetical protein
MMKDNQPFRSILSLTAGTTAATTAAIAASGAIELRNAAAPLNAVSHILWGDGAARQNDTSARYTALGTAINAAAMASWCVLHHVVFRPDRRRAGLAQSLARGAATAAAAYVVDYYVVPRRLTPGFEKRLSGRSIFAVYAALALGLVVGEQMTRRAR